MIAADADFLDVLAACLGAGVPLPDALSRIETAGPQAARWVQRIRPFAQPGSSLEGALLAARILDGAESALLALAVTPDAVEALLRALAVRGRRRSALRGTILRGLIGPFAIAALTVVLDPLPNLFGSASCVWPVFRGLLVLALLSAFVVFSVPALLRSPTLGPRLRGACAGMPGLAWLAALHAEGELVTASAPFVARPQGGSEGLLAVSSLFAWSPLAEKVRAVAAAGAPDLALQRLAPHLSLATNLSIVSGVASKHLAWRLAARGEEIATELVAHTRIVIRVAAYALVVVLTLQSLASLLSRALPGMPLVPGADPSTEQKELDEAMKHL
jgi:hypothetical protein